MGGPFGTGYRIFESLYPRSQNSAWGMIDGPSVGLRMMAVYHPIHSYLKDQMALKSRGPVPMYYESLYDR